MLFKVCPAASAGYLLVEVILVLDLYVGQDRLEVLLVSCIFAADNFIDLVLAGLIEFLEGLVAGSFIRHRVPFLVLFCAVGEVEHLLVALVDQFFLEHDDVGFVESHGVLDAAVEQLRVTGNVHFPID